MADGLFKYFSTDKDKLETFISGHIYLTPPKFFNDPWDFLIRSESWTKEHFEVEGFYVMPEFRADMNSPINLGSEAHDQQNGLSKLVGVVSLAEDPHNRLMWANYGDSHRGFVAEFRYAEKKTDGSGFQTCMTPFGGAGKVDYKSEQILRKREGANLRDVFWTKHIDWKYEQEWRVIESLQKAHSHPNRAGFLLLKFEPTDLLRIIFGLRVCPQIETQLKQMLGRKKFEHVQMEKVLISPDGNELVSRACQPTKSD
jgi:Protein of unknown function (DUF2971)